VLDRAKVRGFRTGDNPASRKQGSPLRELLKDYDVVHPTTKHHASMPYQEVPAFIALNRAHRNQFCGKAPTSGERQLREERPLQSYAVEFQILTAARPGQVVNARWSDFILGNRIWNCPPERHKTGKKTNQPYVIPLSKEAQDILKEMRTRQDAARITSDHVFIYTGDVHYGKGTPGRPLGKKALWTFIRNNLNRTDFNPHGFRTTLSSWANDQDRYTHETIERALGHQVGNQTAQIYSRNSQRLEPMRLLFQAWAEFCNRTEPLGDNVSQFRNPVM
jgi:integrase